uniref:Uncharacterized protein n=1 Tax=Arcella intermedia TaxID=1963864 RepID=A0A6B2LRB3_9EUKA
MKSSENQSTPPPPPPPPPRPPPPPPSSNSSAPSRKCPPGTGTASWPSSHKAKNGSSRGGPRDGRALRRYSPRHKASSSTTMTRKSLRPSTNGMSKSSRSASLRGTLIGLLC